MSGVDDPNVASTEFTEVFVERLLSSLQFIPSHHAGGMPAETLTAAVSAHLGTPRHTGRSVVSCLALMQLISEKGTTIGRSPRGDRVRREIRADGSLPFAIAVVRSGLMADQIRALRAVLRREGQEYVCGRSAARSAAPQLVGLLARMPDVTIGARLRVGYQAGRELDSMWNELSAHSRVNWHDIERRRRAVGERAELYSMQFERSSQLGAWQQIRWVSRDDDGLGYDIEVGDEPTRLVEVKGTSGTGVQFFLSSHEYDVASKKGGAYEIQFWGQINVQRDPVEEYELLRSQGFPLRVADPITALAQPPWVIEPDVYKVTQRAP